MNRATFDRILNERAYVFDPNKPIERQMPCEYALLFQGWVDTLFDQHLASADIVRLNQLKLVIQERYFLWRSRLPGDHRQDDKRKPDHPCVFTVFEAAIGVIHERELALDPPAILVSPKTKPSGPISPVDVLIFGDKDPEFGP